MNVPDNPRRSKDFPSVVASVSLGRFVLHDVVVHGIISCSDNMQGCQLQCKWKSWPHTFKNN